MRLSASGLCTPFSCGFQLLDVIDQYYYAILDPRTVQEHHGDHDDHEKSTRRPPGDGAWHIFSRYTGGIQEEILSARYLLLRFKVSEAKNGQEVVHVLEITIRL